MKKTQKILLIGAAIFLVYCRSQKYIPSSNEIQVAQTMWEQADSTFLSMGSKLYERKCSSCHFLYKPKNYSVRQWKSLLPEMSSKAKLTNEEFLAINVYLLTRSQVENFK